MVTVQDNCIGIKDLGSTNGIFNESGEILESTIYLNQWFRIGYLKFFLKKGNASEFVLSNKIRPLFDRLSNVIVANYEETSTALMNVLYTETLVELLQIGFGLQQYGNLFKHADELMKTTLKIGCLLLVSRKDRMLKIESQWNYKKEFNTDYTLISGRRELFTKPLVNSPSNGSHFFCSFPVEVSMTGQSMVVIYISRQTASAEVVEFLKSLSMEVAVLHSLMEQSSPSQAGKKGEKPPQIITTNPKMLNLLSQCKKIANSNLFVLIEGETGTGKELFGRFIHSNSKRNQGSFIALNCAAIPENLMEVELFGNEKGAFTDAATQRQGKLELASDGTLVLDEIGDMPLNLQAKLLRTIQEGVFYRVGGNQPIKVDLRIICLTNKNVKELMAKKLFREDLYYRIAHVTLKVPPLRERKEDIVPLTNHFMAIASTETGIMVKGFSDSAIQAMEAYDWPGNVREFENEMVKILSLAETNDIIDMDMLKDEIVGYYESNTPVNWTPEMEKTKLVELLEKHKWNKSLVAKELGLSRTTLYEKLKKYDI
jgi:DNA-binding NtrC family response regulator